MEFKFRIRESHLRRAPFGILADGQPLVVNGKLYRVATLRHAALESLRRARLGLGACHPMAIHEMPQVEVYGMDYVIHSSGAN
jgi:hypothetical protein